MATLDLTYQVLAYEDDLPTTNPLRRPINWGQRVASIPVSNPKTNTLEVEPLQESVIFDGTRALTFDGTTQLALSISALGASRYRLAWTGTGAAPGFRTARALSLSGNTLTVTLQANQTVVVTYGGAPPFGAIQVGDLVRLPGASTGDSGPFNPLNEGTWVVLLASSASLTLARASGSVFSGSTEAVVITDNLQVQAYSAAGVQAGDTVDLLSGFAASALRAFEVLDVTARHLEFVSSTALAAQTLIPGVSALRCYTAARCWVLVESDQEVAVKVNGDTTELQRCTPWVPGDKSRPGKYERTGATFALSIKNRSTTTARVVVLSAEP